MLLHEPVCPKCRQRSRVRYPQGRLESYCAPCERGRNKKVQQVYRQTPRGKEAAWQYARSPRGKLVQSKYWKTPKGKALKRRSDQQRRVQKVSAQILRFTTADWERLVSRFQGRCAYCGEKRPLTQEHVIPLARGGRHSIGNILPACLTCNSSKGKKLLVEWRNLNAPS